MRVKKARNGFFYFYNWRFKTTSEGWEAKHLARRKLIVKGRSLPEICDRVRKLNKNICPACGTARKGECKNISCLISQITQDFWS